MHFAFTTEQMMFRDALQDLLEKGCSPEQLRTAWQSDSGHIPQLWAHLAEMGILGMNTPAEKGGLEMDPVDWILLFEELGKFAVPDPVLESGLVATSLIHQLASTDDQANWLPSIIEGKLKVAVSLENPHLILGAEDADILLLRSGDGLHNLHPGDLKLEKQKSVDRCRQIYKIDWAPSQENLICRGPTCISAMEKSANLGALAASAQLIGLGQKLLDETVEYTKIRHQFGRPVGSFQAIQHQLADVLIQLEFARPLVHQAAWTLSGNRPHGSIQVSMAKVLANDAAHAASRAALQCHGAIGYSLEHDLHMWMKRVWALIRTWGDSHHHRERVATEILDNPDAEEVLYA